VKELLRRAVTVWLVALAFLRDRRRKGGTRRALRKLGMLNIEHYHERIGVFGGYGMTTRSIAEFFNGGADGLEVTVLLNRPMAGLGPQTLRLDGTEVILYPDVNEPTASGVVRYNRLLRRCDPDLLLTIEYYSAYFASAFLLPCTPLVVWIHDPRPDDEWTKIATVPLELEVSGQTLEGVLEGRRYEEKTLLHLVRLGRRTGRKVLFATTASCLIEMAKRAYTLPGIEPFFLPIPVARPEDPGVASPEKPSFCFLGRLDPIKRPWIFCELARRFPGVDFKVAGKTHFPKVMNPILDEYRSLANLSFMGLIDGASKHELLSRTWGLVNTSVHEALPVSFEEALAYGKPIVSCQDPDGLVSRFGAYTGELLGPGTDEATLNRFSEALESVLRNRGEWADKGASARERMAKDYSYESFGGRLRAAYAET
jgi:glycosyltransferase involved in cell wall biosynthesis